MISISRISGAAEDSSATCCIRCHTAGARSSGSMLFSAYPVRPRHRERVVGKPGCLVSSSSSYIGKSFIAETVCVFSIRSSLSPSSLRIWPANLEACSSLSAIKKMVSSACRPAMSASSFHIIRDELVDRSLISHIFVDFQISKSSHSDGLCKFQQLFMESFGQLSMYFNARTVLPWNGLNVHLWKKSVTSIIRSGFLRSGLSEPNSSIACL